MKFNLEDFKKRKFVVNCRTEEESKKFLKYLDGTGIRGCKSAMWVNYRKDTCYSFHQGGLAISSCDYYESYDILVYCYNYLSFENNYKVELTYFKKNGKYYSFGSYKTNKDNLYDIWDEVKDMKLKSKLPGIYGNEWIISIDIPNHEYNHPHLIT